MGLTSESTGRKSTDNRFCISKENPDDKVIALAGNPNVGKSTVFNYLTGLKQHTGNWPGKTVTNAQGIANHNGNKYILVDIPGTYSLMPHSREEEVARDFLCFGGADAVVIVCDATCLERNLNLVLQTLEITDNAVVCINLMDEAKKKGIKINIKSLTKQLGVPVVGTSARSGNGLNNMLSAVNAVIENKSHTQSYKVRYLAPIEAALEKIIPIINKKNTKNKLNSRWLALRFLEKDEKLTSGAEKFLETDFYSDIEFQSALSEAFKILKESNIDNEKLKDNIVSCIVLAAEEICNSSVSFENNSYNLKDRKIDKILTGRLTGIPLMLALLGLVFWITINGANIPSAILSDFLFGFEDDLLALCTWLSLPNTISQMFVFGIYRVLSWVVSVMLPPMAIFFPLFTLLEDLGYLPRIAFNLDKVFKKCNACGKQALTMCMGFGCNAAGVIGCRIIDSPRERLIAILTNSFVPCNGRFPILTAIITMFFFINAPMPVQSLWGAFLLTLFVLIGILSTFIISKLLSKTILKGEASSFTLELPPYRRPCIGKILIRSVFDRTLFVLGRAISVAAPAGLIIWIFANVTINNSSLLVHFSGFLDPFARLLGLDGIILMAFILGIPANEIVIPIIIMAYTASGTITDFANLTELKTLFIENGWTWITATSTMLFSLMHWPCSTTLITIKKETKNLKWTVLSFVIPTLYGMLICFIFSNIARLI